MPGRRTWWPGRIGPVGLLLGLSLALRAPAAEAPQEDVVLRYEQILERAPMEGPSFDKLLQIYEQGEGLEKLDARREPLSNQLGAKGANYSLLRGLLADRMGKADKARALLQKATQNAPADFHSWLALGDLETRAGQWPAAIADLQKGLATPVAGEDRLALYRKLGEAQERNLQPDDALATWKKAVAEFARNSFVLEEAGEAELGAEQFDEARKTFQQLVDLTERNSMNRVQAQMRLAEVDDRQGKTKEAVHDYEAILPSTAEGSWLNRELRTQIEQIYRREDDLAGLVAYYRKWTEANPKDVDALLLLSGVLNELGKKPEALDALRNCTVLAPDRHEVRESLAEGLVEAKRYDEAVAVETALTADDPTEPRYWETLGDALWQKTAPPTAASTKATLDAWSHIAPADSKDVAAVIKVAELCQDHHLNDEALANYQRALALTPDAADVREKEAKLLVDLHREPEAWKLLDRMVEGAQATAANYLKLANLQQQFGRHNEALAAIQKGLTLEPSNFDLLSLLWTRLAEDQKWSEAAALFDRLVAAAPNAYFVDQLEVRQVQALTSANELDATLKRLRGQLGATPGLSENEMQLLLRILIQQSDPDVAKAFEEVHRRFPKSVSLTRLEIDSDRHSENFDGAISLLKHLTEIAPEQANDWLAETVRVRQDQGSLGEALNAAQRLIDASPTRADGYLLYSEVALAAGKPDAAVAKWQAAIKLSDKPNDIRQRLARYYMESGQPAKARSVYDDAFATADNPQDKLAIVRAMAGAYYQDGQIETLMDRFRQEQKAEEGGWRYGLYLAAIDESMDDYGAARRELAKSLAQRPQDTGLLHSLIGLADKEGDLAELLKYREALATADPSVTNEIALANEYATQDKPADAWRVMQKNRDAVTKDPPAWKDVLNHLSSPDYAARIKSMLEEAIGSHGNGFDGPFALAQFDLQQGDLEGAKNTLWEIVGRPLPAAPPPAASASKGTAPTASIGALFQNAALQRTQQSYLAMNEAQQLLNAQNPNQMRSHVYFSGAGQVTTLLDPAAIRDHALVYLSVIAVQQKDAEGFLKRLSARLDETHASAVDRMIAYGLVQAREPLLHEIEQQAAAARPDKEADEVAAALALQLSMGSDEDPDRKRAEAAEETLMQRTTAAGPSQRAIRLMKIQRLAMTPTPNPDQVARRDAAVKEYLQALDRHQPDELLEAVSICAYTGNWTEVVRAVNDFAALDRRPANPGLAPQLAFLPLSVLQRAGDSKVKLPPDAMPALMKLLELSYPTTPPQAALPSANQGSGLRFGSFGYNTDAFPPPNRYFPADRIQMLQPTFFNLQTHGLMPQVEAGLDQQEKDLTDWRRIYPLLLRTYFKWWEGKKDDAIAAVRQVLQQEPSDDFRLLLGSMLAQQQRYAEAVTALESVTARYGPMYVHTQMQLLHVAREAKNMELGQKAGLRLLALRLPQQEQMQIVDDLRQVGLKDKADQITARMQGGMLTGVGHTPGGQNPSIQSDQQLLKTLNDAVNGNDAATVARLARQILSRDPFAPAQGYSTILRDQALSGLRKTDQLESYAEEVQKQLATTPDSARQNWLAAEAFQHMEGESEKLFSVAQLPLWLKLQRTGNHFEGFRSGDGSHWTSVASSDANLPAKIYTGLSISTVAGPVPTTATIDHIAFTGKTSPGPVSAPLAPNPGAPAAVTNAAPAAPALPTDLAMPWQQGDLGAGDQPGAAKGGGAALTLTSRIVAARRHPEGSHDVYQMLEGDGSLIARVTDFSSPAGTPNRHVGLAARGSLDEAAGQIFLGLEPTSGLLWEKADPKPAPHERRIIDEFGSPAWMKFQRQGNTFSGYFSADGQDWVKVFSRDFNLPADALVGILATPNTTADAQIQWDSVKVTSTADTSPAVVGSTPAGLPSGWEYADMGNPNLHGTARWDGPELEMNFPKVDPSLGPRLYGCTYRALHGDGEIVAQLKNPLANEHGGWAGLCFRSGKAQDAPEIEFIGNVENRFGYHVRASAADQALAYYQKAAALNPKDAELMFRVAQQLQQTGKVDAAVDIFAAGMKADLTSGMRQSYTVVEAFQQAKRLPELVKIIMDWTPPPLSPLGNGGMDMFFNLQQVAQQLHQKKALPEAEQLYRKLLGLDTPQSKVDSAAGLVSILLEEDRPGDAAAETEKFLLDSGSAPAAAAPPLLGFNMGMRGQTTWTMTMGWDQYGRISSPMVGLLELADDLGLTDKLIPEMRAKPPANNPVYSQIDPNRIALLLLMIIAHRPEYHAELDKLAKDFPVSVPSGANSNVYMLLTQQLARWPEQRPVALRIAQQDFEASLGTPNSFFTIITGLELVRIAEQVGDHKSARTALKQLEESCVSQLAANRNQTQPDQLLLLIRMMARESMTQEAGELLDATRTSHAVAGNPQYYDPKIEQAQKEIAFSQGSPGPVSFVYGLAPRTLSKTSGTEFSWQIHQETKIDSQYGYCSTSDWQEMVPLRPTTCTLELKGGPDEQHLAHLASFPRVASYGSVPVKIPASVRVVQAVLTAKPASAKAGGPPSQMDAPILGHLVLVGDARNLLANPSLLPAPRRGTERKSIAGWSGLAASSISQQTGGPAPSVGFQLLKGPAQESPVLVSEKIPVQAGADYVFSGWIKSIAGLEFHYLDAAGKEIGQYQTSGATNEESWVWRTHLLKGGAQNPEQGDRIPPQTAFITISLSPMAEAGVSNLSFRLFPPLKVGH